MVTIRIARMIREILCEPAASVFAGIFRGKSPSPEALRRNDRNIQDRMPDDEGEGVLDR